MMNVEEVGQMKLNLKAPKLKGEKEAVGERELAEIKRDRAKLAAIQKVAYEAQAELNKTPAALHLAALNGLMVELRKSLDIREENVVTRLRRGVRVIGKLRALIEVVKGQCRPSWKDAFGALATRMGLSVADEEKRVRDETEVPKEYRLVIE